MRFSALDVIEREREMLAARKNTENAGIIGKLFGSVVKNDNPRYVFTFQVPQYFFIRSLSLCRDISDETESIFGVDDLAEVLYIDFLEYIQDTNDIQNAYKKLCARELMPVNIGITKSRKKVSNDNEIINVSLEHRDALKGEFLLHDLLELYPDHEFTVENILEIVFCEFVDGYRKGLIKNPIAKITQYLE